MTQTGESKDSQQSKLKTIWFFLKPYKLHIFALFALAAIIGILETTTVAAIYPIVSLGMNMESGQSNMLLSLIDKLAMILPLEDTFVSSCILIILLVITVFIVKSINTYFSAYLATNVVREVQEMIFRKQMGADYEYFLSEKQGGLVYISTIANESVWRLVTGIVRMLSGAILIISIFILLFTMNWKGATLVVLVGVGYYLATQYIGTRVSYITGVGIARTSTSQHVILNEVFNGIKHIKVSLSENKWIKKFEMALREYYSYCRKAMVWGEIPGHGLWLLLFIAIVVVAMILRIQSPAGLTSLFPLFGTFAFAMLRLLSPVTDFGVQRMQIMSALPNAELTYVTLHRQLSKIKDGRRELKSFTHDMQFDNVSFTYKGRKTTLKDVSITMEKGKTTAIVGPSGAGKTTIVDLLLRLNDPDKGEIKIDGVSLKEYKLSSWLKRIGFVSQDTFIFHDTIKNNIAFSTNAYSDKEIIEASRAANAHDFILEFPQGYDTIVGERGMKLSGGQKQRIAIARAIVRKPEILILDEATSALDNVSEAMVQEAISQLSKNRTVIVIAHRLSTIINADKIVVLEGGRVKEEGTDAELRDRRGVYWKLYQVQDKIEK